MSHEHSRFPVTDPFDRHVKQQPCVDSPIVPLDCSFECVQVQPLMFNYFPA